MNFSSHLHCSQIYCLALQFLPSLLMFTLNSHFIFTFTFWVPCWSGWINIKSFSFPSDQLMEFSHLEDVGCLEYFYQIQTKLTFKLDFPGNLWEAAFAILAMFVCFSQNFDVKVIEAFRGWSLQDCFTLQSIREAAKYYFLVHFWPFLPQKHHFRSL